MTNPSVKLVAQQVFKKVVKPKTGIVPLDIALTAITVAVSVKQIYDFGKSVKTK